MTIEKFYKKTILLQSLGWQSLWLDERGQAQLDLIMLQL